MFSLSKVSHHVLNGLLCNSTFPGALFGLNFFWVFGLVSAFSRKLVCPQSLLCCLSSLKFGFIFSERNSQLSLLTQSWRGSSEYGPQGLPEAILSCLPFFLRSFPQDGIFPSCRKLLHVINSHSI